MSQILNDETDQEPPKLEGCSLGFADIFREFEHPVHSYLLHLTQDQAKAEDLAQETFIRVFDKLKTFRGEASLRTWIYRIATNVSIDHFWSSAALQDKVNQSFEEELEEWPDQESPPPEHQIEQSEMSDCVQEFIQRLPLSYRTGCELDHDERDVLVCEPKA
jgi:RNA polymerase sigma factor (sigma-70 family)